MDYRAVNHNAPAAVGHVMLTEPATRSHLQAPSSSTTPWRAAPDALDSSNNVSVEMCHVVLCVYICGPMFLKSDGRYISLKLT